MTSVWISPPPPCLCLFFFKDFREDMTTPLSEVMTTDLVVAEEPCTLLEANLILRESKKGCA